jgi:hypothetical protein
MVGLRLPRSPILGLSVGREYVRAVVLERGVIQWAGQAPYEDLPELAEVVARLAAESGKPVRRARVVLERTVVQLRSIVPAPPLKPTAARRFIALEAPRLFRQNGAPLVTDGTVLRINDHEHALYAAAVPEPLVRQILEGCAQAGLYVEALGPAADILPLAFHVEEGLTELVLPNCSSSEVISIGPAGAWRSRLLPAAASTQESTGEGRRCLSILEPLGSEATHYAPAYTATVAAPRLDLMPGDARAARERAWRRRRLRVALLGAALCFLAGAVYLGRLVLMLHASTSFLDAVGPGLDSALLQRRDLHSGEATLETISHARLSRSRQLALIAKMTTALGDSVFLVALRIGPDGTIRLAGYAPSAARVVADLERDGPLRDVQLEGSVTREAAFGLLDRLGIVARLENHP